MRENEDTSTHRIIYSNNGTKQMFKELIVQGREEAQKAAQYIRDCYPILDLNAIYEI